MAAKAKLCLLIVIFSASVLIACAIAEQEPDPELKQCKHQCRVQQQYSEEEKEECVGKCEDYHREKTDQQSSTGKECRRQCERVGREERRLCILRCQQKWGEPHELEEEDEEEEKVEQKHKHKHNPYVFHDQHFSTKAKTQEGRADVLTKFTDKSEFFSGIERYRLALLVVNPNAFVLPNHFDADAVFVVTQGHGTITLIHENKRESFNIKLGDIIRVRAGTPVYLINRDSHEKLFIVKLLQSVNVPGDYSVFFGASGEKPESFLKAFSSEILEAALKTSGDKLDEFFERQDQGPFLKASEKQIRAMSRHTQGGSIPIWPFGSDSRTVYNLFQWHQPSHSNKYGQLFEVDGAAFEPLKQLDLKVSHANITKGCMSSLLFNSRATKIAIVVRGEGYIEMVSPHKDSTAGRKGSPSPGYRKFSSRLRPDTVFVVPAGHPFVTVASRNENLELLGFSVNNQDNVKHSLAGKGNIVQLFEKEAKELAFKTSEEEVDKIFNSQDEEFFFPGPRQHRGRAYYE